MSDLDLAAWREELIVLLELADSSSRSGSPIRVDEQPQCIRLAEHGLAVCTTATGLTFQRTLKGDRVIENVVARFMAETVSYETFNQG